MLSISENKYVQMVKEFAANENSQVIVCKIESEIAELDEEEKVFLEELGIEESGLDH